MTVVEVVMIDIEFKYKKPALPCCPHCNTKDSILVETTRLFECGHEVKSGVFGESIITSCKNRYNKDCDYTCDYDWSWT